MQTESSISVLDRRRSPRHAIQAQITVLYPEFWTHPEPNQLRGWTHNVSEGGVCFSVPFRIPHPQMVVHVDYDGMGAEYVLATVIQEIECPDGSWRYHCQIDRTMATIEALFIP